MERNVVGVIASLFFLVFGATLLLWPDRVRKYDGKMTLVIKDPQTYRLLARSIGVAFLLAAGLVLIILKFSA